MAKGHFTRRNFVLKSATGIGGLAISRYAANAAVVEKEMEKAQVNDSDKINSNSILAQEDDVIIENDELKLIIGSNAVAKSLLCKSTGEECLISNHRVPISTITQERPYNNEVKLAYPCQQMTFGANSIKKTGDKLFVGYELLDYQTIILINIKAGYVEFKLGDFVIPEGFGGLGVLMKDPAIWRISFLQLPVRKRSHYGDWLQVVWDDKVATNILATNPFTNIGIEKGDNFYLLKATAEREIKLKGVSATLITCSTNKLLDNIARVENDYNLPQGVNSRRRKEYRYSYYWTHDLNNKTIDQHLKYAKLGGFRAMHSYYISFLNGDGALGNYEWDRSLYPNGKEDLRKLLDKLKDNGITPGFHFLHSHISLNSKYVTPVPDHRLNVVQTFTLARSLNESDTTIHVDQDPSYIEMTSKRRILRMGSELISYDGFTNEKPFKITGCKRGILNTQPSAHPVGYVMGVLDVSEFGAQSVYINQDNDLQDEIAEKLADIYDAGFQFCYYDGSEGVNAPFWFNIAYAQWKVYHRLNPQPLFAEGAAKTHFSWHMLSRGNAFDIFHPEVLKEEIKRHPAAEAPRMKENFTHINFGWLGYWVPDEKTVGTQPDMLEYVSSRAAAWDCPISIQSSLKKFDDHPRTADNFEVMRRWEEARNNDLLTKEQKLSLQQLEQEHILLINEKNEFELQPYDQITNVAGNSREVRAFTFERGGNLYVVYWHISGTKKLELSLPAKNVTVVEELHRKSPVAFSKQSGHITVPVSNRRYIKTRGITKDQVITAFQNAKIS